MEKFEDVLHEMTYKEREEQFYMRRDANPSFSLKLLADNENKLKLILKPHNKDTQTSITFQNE